MMLTRFSAGGVVLPEPPGWTGWVFVLASLCVVVSAIWRRREEGQILTLDRQREILIIAGSISAVTLATLLSRAWFDSLAVHSIVLGFAIGYGCVLGLQLEVVQKRINWPRRKKILFGWFGVVVLTVVGIGPMAQTYAVLLGILPWLALLGGGMVIYNAGKISP